MSKQDSESDINVDDTQDQENSQAPETLQIHIVTTQQCMIKMIQYMMNINRVLGSAGTHSVEVSVELVVTS